MYLYPRLLGVITVKGTDCKLLHTDKQAFYFGTNSPSNPNQTVTSDRQGLCLTYISVVVVLRLDGNLLALLNEKEN